MGRCSRSVFVPGLGESVERWSEYLSRQPRARETEEARDDGPDMREPFVRQNLFGRKVVLVRDRRKRSCLRLCPDGLTRSLLREAVAVRLPFSRRVVSKTTTREIVAE